MKRNVVVVMCLAALMLASVTVLAQDAITINGGGQTVLMKAPSHTVNRPFVAPKGLKTIYTNLGKNPVYVQDTGWTISGKSSGPGLWIQGCAFTPKAAATLTEIKVAFTWVTGTPNQGTVALYSDVKGAPGKVLHTFPAVKNLPTFGQTDSILQTVKFAKGVKLQKGKQYWVVLSSPDPVWNVWNWSNSATGNEAYNNGNGWTVRQINLGAFAVYGH